MLGSGSPRLPDNHQHAAESANINRGRGARPALGKRAHPAPLIEKPGQSGLVAVVLNPAASLPTVMQSRNGYSPRPRTCALNPQLFSSPTFTAFPPSSNFSVTTVTSPSATEREMS